MKIGTFSLLAGATFVIALVLQASPALAGTAKVEICHIPPGNPDNFHTITVSESAVEAHLAHGDAGSSCDEYCETRCDDGDACTIDACDPAGGCAPPAPVDCNDGDLCTTDSCDPASGCVNTCVTCDPPDACTISTCAPDTGECVDTPVVCPDGETCNPESGGCEPGECFTALDWAGTDDAAGFIGDCIDSAGCGEGACDFVYTTSLFCSDCVRGFSPAFTCAVCDDELRGFPYECNNLCTPE
jgi:hypothetical protein